MGIRAQGASGSLTGHEPGGEVGPDRARLLEVWSKFVVLCALDERARIVTASPGWERLGFRTENVLDRACAEILHPDDRDSFAEALATMTRDASKQHVLEARLRLAENCYLRTSWSFRRFPDGTFAAQVTDAAAVHATFEQYRLGFEASPVGLVVVDPRGVITQVNPRIAAMFGYGREELIGTTIETLIPHDLRDHHRHSVENYHRSPTARSMGRADLCGLRKDGTRLPVEIALNPLMTSEGPRVLATIVDVSLGRERERALQDRVSELRRYREETVLLREMSSLLQHALTAEEALEVVTSFGRRLLSIHDVAIYTVPTSRDRLECQVTWGQNQEQQRGLWGFTPDACWALRRLQTHHSLEGHAPHCAHLQVEPGRWQICVPMSAHGESSGVLAISSTHDLKELDPSRTEEVGRVIADQLALALSSIQLRDALRNLSVRDPLTGLYNRRYLEESVSREMRRGERRGTPISLLMLDVDHFKRFNDTMGHPAGDLALQELSSLLQTKVRGEDIVCRYGGEEFIVLLPECSLENALKRAETIRGEVAAKVDLEITVSIGAAEWPRHGRAWLEFLAKADLALYDAKRRGRNRVVAAPDSTLRGEELGDAVSCAAAQ